MNSLKNVLFLLMFFSTLILNVCGTYTHAAFVNDIRRSQRRESRRIISYDSSEEYSLQMNQTSLLGLQRCSHFQCKRIAVVGAGVAGLIIAYELTLAGHQVEVYEANDRPGGRLLTYDTGNTIIELGGMRFPLDIHTLTDTYIRKRFDLPLEPFVSSDPNTFIYINGIKHRSDNTSYLPNEYDLPVDLNEENQSPFVRWTEAIKPLYDLFLTVGWNAIVDQYGSYNVKQYLSDFGLSDSMIDYIGLLFGIETNLFTALTSHFRDALLINEHTKFSHIIGGNKRLIDQLSKPCQINYSTSVLSIHRNEDQTINMTIKDSIINITKIINIDRVIVATTAPAARFIRYTPVDNQVKQMSRALRQLHYDCSSKIVLYFNRSWWNDQNITGGSTTTDLPLRFIYYDNYNTTIDQQNQTEFVLLASYAFAQDSTFWSSSTNEQITNEALNNLEEIHSRNDLRKYYLRTIVKHWCDDSYSHGAYALFLPYQEEDLKPILMKSLNNQIYFAGEHLSTAHAWVEGSILSALRVLMQIQEEICDVLIVDGGLLGLQTAKELIDRQPTWNILIIEQNQFFNSFCSNQFEPSKDNQTTKLFLQFGSNISNGELNSTDLMKFYQFENLPNNYRGQINGKIEYRNTRKMIIQMLNILKQEKYQNLTIRENERFINSDQNQIITDRRTLFIKKKILFLDNCYLNDQIQQSIQLNIKFEQFSLLSFSSKGNNSFPTWLYNDQLLYFHINQIKFEEKILFLNSNLSQGLSWLTNHTSSFIDINSMDNISIYKQTTLNNPNNIIDYLPNSNNRSILFLGRTDIDSYPLWIKILADLTEDKRSSIMQNYSIPIIINASFHLTSSIYILFFFLFIRSFFLLNKYKYSYRILSSRKFIFILIAFIFCKIV